MGGRRRAENQGWEKQFVTDERRVEEFRELYDSMDLEMKVEPAEPEGKECNECFRDAGGKYVVIYTRKKKRNRAL